MELVTRTFMIGIGATIVMDLWGLMLARAFGLPSPNYAMVGRWFGHMPAGRFAHAGIAAAAAVRGESILGWTAHYAIGIAYGALLVAVAGESWVREPTPLPALAIGLVTVVAPYFIMQPALGMGFAASKAPKPNVARLRTLVTHLVFGAGLYATAWVLAQFLPLGPATS
jgi:hypothetical protein